ADALIGIYPEAAVSCPTSGVLTFDLTPYKQTGLNDTSIMESTVVNPKGDLSGVIFYSLLMACIVLYDWIDWWALPVSAPQEGDEASPRMKLGQPAVMSIYWFKNFVGIRQSEFELLRVPAPSTEFCIHVTMRSVQTGALLGSILGPLTAMMFEGKNMSAKRL
ncbi:hypothetical protein OSTOST_22633, partial [Ostertagia ostertagi]